jgi:serine/threonine-protein kinase
VGVTDFFEEGDNAYLVMKLIEGENLAERIERQGAISEKDVLVWADQLLDALAYCHEQGVLHRDIKPHNVIIQPNGRVVLVDFGLVKLWDPQAPGTQTVVRGSGTPEYAPPEQYDIRGTGHTDPRTDIYSLGATLYHALIGSAPPTATQRIVNPAALASVRTVHPQISPHVESALMKALELRPNARFQSISEMRTALKTPALVSPPQREPIAPAPAVQAEPLPPVRAKRGRRAAFLIPLIVLLVGAAILGTIWLSANRPPSATPTSTVEIVTPSPEIVPTATNTNTPTPTDTPLPTSTPTPAPTETPAPAAVVLSDDANLRPGASTWWNPRDSVPVGTELELVGYDPDFPDWVYVRTVDDQASSGWIQIAELEINRELSELPLVTPVPTIAPTATPTEDSSPPAGCATGPLELDAWPVGTTCLSSTSWTVSIYAEGRGGDCTYTYAWEGVVQAGPVQGSATFVIPGGGGAVAGTVSVTSAGETATKSLYVAAPDCD